MVWVSVVTLLVSIATLVIVWQMQKNMAHTNADAALTLPQRQQNNCEGRGGTWTQGPLLGQEGEYHCREKDGKTINNYDKNGIQLIP